MRNELAEAVLKVEQLSAQESVLQATIRALETDLKTKSAAAYCGLGFLFEMRHCLAWQQQSDSVLFYMTERR
eukprot:g17407.t1